MSYDAFLCFSHADRDLAVELSHAIARFSRRSTLGIPFLGQSGIRIFRADDAGQGLADSKVLSALTDSRYLILIASPSAAHSAWVERELEAWLQRRSSESILVVLADGTPESALPAALGSIGDRYWTDLRWTKGIESASDRPQFKDVVASLSAAIVGVSKDSLLAQDARRNRRSRRFTIVALAGLLLMTILSFVGTYSAYQANELASFARQEAAMARENAYMEAERTAVAKATAETALNAAAVSRMAAEAGARQVADLQRALREANRRQGAHPIDTRVYERQIENSQAEVNRLRSMLDASNADIANLTNRVASTEAARDASLAQLTEAQAELLRVTSSPSMTDRALSAAANYKTELLSAATAIFVILTFSTNWILLLLKLEIKPISVVAVPFYLTRFGRWRLFHSYRKRAVSSEIEFHGRCYMDIPYADSVGTFGTAPLIEFMRSEIRERNVVVVAGGGRGKTTLCHRMMLEALRERLQADGRLVVPVEVDGLTYDGNLLQSITDSLLQSGTPVNKVIVDAQLTAGTLMIIFDGWSEVRAFVEGKDDNMDAPATVRRYPRTRFIFSSRTSLPPSLERALGEPSIVHLQDLDKHTIAPFLARYLETRSALADDLARAIVESPASLPYSPLMLMLVASVFDKSGQVPNQRTTLFDEYLRELFRPSAAKVDPIAIEFLVKHLTRSTYLANRGRRGFPLHRGVELVSKIKDVLDGFGVRSLPIELLKLLEGAGLYRRSGDRMRCFHDSFESYFAAKVLYDDFTDDRNELLFAIAGDVTFGEALEFLIEIARNNQDAPRLLAVIETAYAASRARLVAA